MRGCPLNPAAGVDAFPRSPVPHPAVRARKVSKALKMVDADTRREVEIGRLQALEEEQDFGGDPDDQDEAYHVSEDEGASSDEGADVKPPAAGRTSRVRGVRDRAAGHASRPAATRPQAAKNKAKAAITTTQPKALSRGPSSSAGGPRAFGSAARCVGAKALAPAMKRAPLPTVGSPAVAAFVSSPQLRSPQAPDQDPCSPPHRCGAMLGHCWACPPTR